MKIPFTKKSFMLALAALALATFACRFTGGQPAAVASQPTASASQPTLPAPSSSAPCQVDYFPVKVGASWTFSGKSVAGSYTRVSTITGMGTDNFQDQSVLTDSNGKQVATAESWNCSSAGLVQLGGPLAATLQGLVEGATMKTISTVGVTIPTHINPGDTWSQDTQLELTTPNGTISGTINYSFQAVGPEQVTVPAGTFNAMKVHVTSSSKSQISGIPVTITSDGFDWFASGVGRVKSSENVTANGNSLSDVEGDLQSYHLP
jgi:hypothetical protein